MEENQGESMVSEIRMDKAREWLEFQGVKKWLDNTPNIDGYELAYETVVELCATYAESECSRLASRVEELENALQLCMDVIWTEFHCGEGQIGSPGSGEEIAYKTAEKLLAGAHAEEK